MRSGNLKVEVERPVLGVAVLNGVQLNLEVTAELAKMILQYYKTYPGRASSKLETLWIAHFHAQPDYRPRG